MPPRQRPGPTRSRARLRLLVTHDLVEALGTLFAHDTKRRHESIAYLFGLTTGSVTLAVSAMRPEATTTYGSFEVSGPAMARVVRAAADQALHVVGQVHTHPGLAYHSDGDEEGARIAYTGYASIVLPYYGRSLPSLVGAAAFIYSKGAGFVPLEASELTVVSGTVR